MLIFSLNSFLKVLTSFVHCCEFLIQWGSLDCWFLPGRGDSTRLWRYTCAIKVIIYKSIQIKHLRAVVAQGLCTRFIIPEHHYNLVDSIGNANKPEESSNPLVAPEKLYTTALTWWRHISPAFSESWPAWRTGLVGCVASNQFPSGVTFSQDVGGLSVPPVSVYLRWDLSFTLCLISPATSCTRPWYRRHFSRDLHKLWPNRSPRVIRGL